MAAYYAECKFFIEYFSKEKERRQIVVYLTNGDVITLGKDVRGKPSLVREGGPLAVDE